MRRWGSDRVPPRAEGRDPGIKSGLENENGGQESRGDRCRPQINRGKGAEGGEGHGLEGWKKKGAGGWDTGLVEGGD